MDNDAPPVPDTVYTLTLKAKADDRLKAIMAKCETDDPSVVFRNALRLFEAILTLTEQGYTFQRVKDGKVEPINFFGP